MGVPLYVICCFSYSPFICNFCHDYNVSLCVPLWVHFVWDCFCFLEFGNCFAPKIRKFEAIISSDMFLGPLSPSSTFGDPYNVNISDALVLPEVSCFFFSFFLFFFFFAVLYSLTLQTWPSVGDVRCMPAVAVISTTLPCTSLIQSSVSFSLLLIPSSVFFISVIVFFICVWQILIFSNSYWKKKTKQTHNFASQSSHSEDPVLWSYF